MLLNLNPLLYYEDDFLSNYECDKIIELSKDSLDRSKVGSSDNSHVSEHRTSSNAWLHLGSSDFVDNVYKRLEGKLLISTTQAEAIQVINYGATQEYKPHHDTFQPDEVEKQGSQRVMTALLYLNTPISGGGTSFPSLHKRVDAMKGRLVIFSTVFPGTKIQHPLALHGGEPVGMGEKWAANVWYRDTTYPKPAEKSEAEEETV